MWDNHGVIYLHGYTMKDGEAKWTLINMVQWAYFPQWHEFREKRISHIIQDYAERYDWFAPKHAPGLTQAGQVNVRSSTLGSGGRAKEAQSEFIVLMEDLIRQPDLAQSVQRYQLAVDQAKVRLNLAMASLAWLINTASVVGYNNNLKQAVSRTKLGVNNGLNTDTKKSALKLMEGGPSKINPPNSHPSNAVHKAATADQDPRPSKKRAAIQKARGHPKSAYVLLCLQTRLGKSKKPFKSHSKKQTNPRSMKQTKPL